jgi:hypothetical protein
MADNQKQDLKTALAEVLEQIKPTFADRSGNWDVTARPWLTNALFALAEVDAPRSDEESAFLIQAQDEWAKDGEIEIDDHAVVSVSDDGGAYVQAWVWVDGPEDDDGFEECPSCLDPMSYDEQDACTTCQEKYSAQGDSSPEIDSCSACGASIDNGEGYDGKCGNCADAEMVDK